jgi:subtilase family serine protease
MKKGPWVRAAAVFLLAATALATVAQAQERQSLSTHMTAPSGARVMGRLAASQKLDMAITLQLRNQAQLQALLQRLYDPKSPDYRKFLSVAQFTQQFGPTQADYDAVVNFATGHGLTVTGAQPANRLVVKVNGAVANIEAAFHVNMQVYQHPTEDRTFYAPDTEPSVDAGLAVSGVSGLNNFHPPRPVYLKRTSDTVRSNSTGSMGGQYLGSDIRAAYLPGVTLNGAGQTVGLFEFGPYNVRARIRSASRMLRDRCSTISSPARRAATPSTSGERITPVPRFGCLQMPTSHRRASTTPQSRMARSV